MLSLKAHFKRTWQLAVPVIIGQLGWMMMGVVDSVMVGSLGPAPLAAASLGNSLIMVLFIIGVGCAMAVTPLVAISVGAKKFEECGIYFRQSLLVNLLLAAVTFIITLIAADLIPLFNQPDEVTEQAISYTKILGFSVFPMMLFMTYKQFIEGLSIMRPAMIIVLIANIVNAMTNWILIYGNLGFPSLGLNGAGWATFASRIFMMLVIGYYVMHNKTFESYDVNFHFRNINKKVIKKILKLGIPSGFQYFFEIGAFAFAVIMVGWLGTKPQAAHQIAINLASISFMAVLGISNAGSIRVGNAVGMQDITQVRRAGFSAILLGCGIMLVSGIIFITLNHYLPMLYIDDPEVISIASTLLIIAAFFQLSDGIQAVGIGVLRGLTDVKIPTIITFVAYWIIGLPVGYILGFLNYFGVKGIWIGLLVGLTASAIMLTIRFNIKSRHPVSF